MPWAWFPQTDEACDETHHTRNGANITMPDAGGRSCESLELRR